MRPLLESLLVLDRIEQNMYTKDYLPYGPETVFDFHMQLHTTKKIKNKIGIISIVLILLSC